MKRLKNKNVFYPDVNRVLFSLIILSLSFFFSYRNTYLMGDIGVMTENHGLPIPYVTIFDGMAIYNNFSLVIALLDFAFWYLVSCVVIVFLFNNRQLIKAKRR